MSRAFRIRFWACCYTLAIAFSLVLGAQFEELFANMWHFSLILFEVRCFGAPCERGLVKGESFPFFVLVIVIGVISKYARLLARYGAAVSLPRAPAALAIKMCVAVHVIWRSRCAFALRVCAHFCAQYFDLFCEFVRHPVEWFVCSRSFGVASREWARCCGLLPVGGKLSDLRFLLLAPIAHVRDE